MEEDRYLLGKDFEALRAASDDCKETWIAEMETALSYTAHKCRRASALDEGMILWTQTNRRPHKLIRRIAFDQTTKEEVDKID